MRRAYGRKLLKVFLWILGSISGLIILLFAILQLPASQRFIGSQIKNYYYEQTGANLEVSEVNISLPNSIVIHDLYLEDMSSDSMLFINYLKVNIDLFALLGKKIHVDKIILQRTSTNIYRTPRDSVFNFQKVINALAGEQKSDTTSAGWQFSLNKIRLSAINFKMNDQYGKVRLNIKEADINTNIKNFNPEDMKIAAGEIYVGNANVSLFMFADAMNIPSDQGPAVPIPWQVDANKLILQNIRFSYEDSISEENLTAYINYSTLIPENINLPEQMIHLNELNLVGSDASFTISGREQTDIPTTASDHQPWELIVDQLNLSGNAFSYNNTSIPDTGIGFNNEHIEIKQLSADIDNISILGPDIKADVKQLALKEKKGLEIKHFKGRLKMDNTHIALNRFEIFTGNSLVQRKIEVDFPSLETIGQNPAEIRINADLRNSTIALNDIIYFAPSLLGSPILAHNRNKSINISASVEGTLDRLKVNSLQAGIAGNTNLALSGLINNVADPDNLYLDIDIENLTTSDQAIASLLPGQVIPKEIDLPSSIKASGTFKGKPEEFDARVNLNTTYGNLHADINMSMPQVYQGSAGTDKFDLGQLLNMPDTLGDVSFEVRLDGRGFSPDQMNTRFYIDIEQANLLDYNYKGITAEGTLKENTFSGSVNILDSNLVLNFQGMLQLKDTLPEYDFVADLRGADLKALNLTKDDIKIKALINSDIKGKDLNNISGKLSITEVLVEKHGKRFTIDSLICATILEKQKTDISIRSDFVSADFKGNINIADLPLAMKQHIDHYFDIHGVSQQADPLPQDFKFNVDLKSPDILTKLLIEDLQEFTPGEISGNYDSESYQLNLTMNIPHITYKGVSLDTLEVLIDSEQNKLTYSIKSANLSIDTLAIPELQLAGSIGNDMLISELTTQDNSGNINYRIGATTESIDHTYSISLDPDNLILNNSPWKLAENNQIIIKENVMVINDLVLASGNKTLNVNTTTNDKGQRSLNFSFANFELDDITGIVDYEGQLSGGEINGDINIFNYNKKPLLTSNLQIRDFTFMSATLGDVSLYAETSTGGRVNIEAEIQGKENDLRFAGYYDSSGEKNLVNFNFSASPLNLATIRPLTFGQLRNASGYLNSRLTITGTNSEPNVNGWIEFDETKIHPELLGNYLQIDDQRINVDGQGLHFQNFAILDSLGNRSVVNGDVLTENYKNYQLDLDVVTSNFRMLNTSKAKDELFYGTLIADSYTSITGTINFPVINTDATVKEGTSFNLILPGSELSVEQEGIVEFIDVDAGNNPVFGDLYEQNDTITTKIKGLEVNVNLAVEEGAKFRMYIDPATGDYLQVHGSGNLNLGIDQGGQIAMSGRYELSKGYYQVTFSDFIRKQFDLKKGSTITWFGTPLDARVDVYATYTARTSAAYLVANQVTNIGDAQFEALDEILPFLVNMHMTGDLTNPDIAFQIDLPEDERGAAGGIIHAKLQQLNQQESELNKQVFGLLAFNRFLSEDPLAGGTGGGIAGTARGSVSKILTQQLNRLSSQYIPGVDVTFDVQSYGGLQGGATELGVQLSKQLLNERLSVTVGGDFGIEGERAATENLNSLAGDISAEYQLDENGNYRLKAFRQDEYLGLLEGQVIETGVAIIYNKDYNKIGELFNNKKKEKGKEEEMEMEKEEEKDE